MFEVEEPMSWNIKIEPLISGDYLLDYVESYPNDELHMKRIKDTKDLVSFIPEFSKSVEIVEKDKTIELHFKYMGKKQEIIDMVTGEFLCFSRLGKKTLQNMFTQHFFDVCDAGFAHSTRGMLCGTSNKIDGIDSNE